MLTGKNYEPLGAQLLYAGELTDGTAKGIVAYPGIESIIGQTAITYTDNSKTITSIDEDLLGFVVSANTNLFVGQCIKLGETQVCVITGIDGTAISVDRKILTTIEAGGKVEESAYYSVYRMDKDAKSTVSTINDWGKYVNYFFLELKGGQSDGRMDLVFPNSENVDDYYVDYNISTKPISMVKINASNAAGIVYYFKPF